MPLQDAPSADHELLLEAMQALSHAQELEEITSIVKRAARRLARADGVTFVLRDGDRCWYVDESAIAPLWKGGRFPINACVSGWAMLHRETLLIDDVLADARVPHDLYRPTFVRSLAMVPIRRAAPLGAIGAYWDTVRRPEQREVSLLESLAASTATAIMNAELQRQLRDAIALREEFITVAAHELRTPLTPLGLQLQGLSRALDGRETQDRLRGRVGDIERSLERVQRLVDAMLDQTALWNDRLTLVRDDADLRAIARHAVDAIGPRARMADTTITLRDGDPVPLAHVDASRVQQAISQLLDNAVKFGAQRPVTVEVDGDEQSARVIVRDQGDGLSADAKDRLFHRFARGVPTEHFGGFGLGLWVAHQIATAHGGSISVDSERGKGATFTLALPRG